MPVTRTAAPVRRRGPARKSAKGGGSAYQAPALMADPNEQERPTEHNGLHIEREEPLMSLPNAPFRYTRLHLIDGSTAFACRDCLTTTDTRGQILIHRNAEHGARIGKKNPRVALPELGKREAPDLVLAPRADGTPVPEDPMMMRLGELLALMPSIAALGDLVERLEVERDQAVAELDGNRIDKATQHKIDVYDHHRQEILDLRLALNRQANYEQVKDELYALRAWKKKIEAKLKAVGFVLSEEE